MAFNLGALLNPGNTYFNGGSHQVNNFPGTSLFGTHKKTDLDDTNTSAGQTIDSNHDGKYTAGTDKVLAMDLNHDGKITRSDLTGTKARLQAMGGNFDLNNDGKTSWVEKIVGKKYQKDMNKKDTNHDGKLDAQEFDQAGGRVLVDRNRDGQLTPNESFSPFKFPTAGFGSGHLNYIDPMQNGIHTSVSRNPSPWQTGGGFPGGGFPQGGGFPGGFPGGGFPQGGGFPGGFPGGGFPQGGGFPGGFPGGGFPQGGGFPGGFPGGGFPQGGGFPGGFPGGGFPQGGGFPMMPQLFGGMQGGCF